MSQTIPERVSEAIIKSGLDDDEIGELIKKDPSTIYRWRNQETQNYSKNKLKIIADALNVRYEWLRFGEGEMNSSKTNDPRVQYAGSVDLPKSGKLSRDHHVQLLRQIESIARILANNLESK